MNLQEFVTETLVQIVAGVKEAQTRTKDSGARVSPSLSTDANLAIKHALFYASGEVAQLVQFDVALTAMEGTGTKGGIGVMVGAFALGSSGQSQAENSSLSRVKFAVPLVLPEGPWK